MVEVNIYCPVCFKKGNIEVSEESVEQSIGGILAIHVATDLICEHGFYVYLDRNLAIRDCYAADFMVEFPKISIDEEEPQAILSREELDLDIIKINIAPTLITAILKAIFLKKKILIITEEGFLHKHLINFFKYITQNAFDTDITILTIVDYMKDKKKYKKHFILGQSKILKNPYKIKDPKKLKIEKNLAHNFYNERDSTHGLIVLRNEILKIHVVSLTIVEFIENYKEKEQVTKDDIDNYLLKKHSVKLPSTYLGLLFEIVENYFEIEIPKKMKFILKFEVFFQF